MNPGMEGVYKNKKPLVLFGRGVLDPCPDSLIASLGKSMPGLSGNYSNVLLLLACLNPFLSWVLRESAHCRTNFYDVNSVMKIEN